MNDAQQDGRRKHWGPTIRRQIWEVQDRRCFYCARELKTWTGQHMHLDHVNPLGQQGPDELFNLVAACVGCNLEKSGKTFPELVTSFGGRLPGAIVAEQIQHAASLGEGPAIVFHEPKNFRRELLKATEEAGRKVRLKDPFDFYDLPAIKRILDTAVGADFQCESWIRRAKLIYCQIWEENGRPYFNLYPVVEEAIRRTSLQITAGQACGQYASEEFCIAVCLGDGREPIASGNKLCQLQVGVTQDSVPTLHILAHTLAATGPFEHHYFLELDRTFDEPGLTQSGDVSDDLYVLCGRLAVGVLLLAQDERFVEPILLARDRERELPPDAFEKAVERARNRTGMRGFTIGRDWVASPHVRRAHFAIRWTEKGRTTPRLVPVKGCIVRRSELLKVPTGYKTYADEDEASTG